MSKGAASLRHERYFQNHKPFAAWAGSGGVSQVVVNGLHWVEMREVCMLVLQQRINIIMAARHDMAKVGQVDNLTTYNLKYSMIGKFNGHKSGLREFSRRCVCMPRFVSGTNRQRMVAEWSSWDWGLGACSSTDKVDRVKRRYPMTSLHRAPHSPHSTYPKDKLERFACEKGAC